MQRAGAMVRLEREGRAPLSVPAIEARVGSERREPGVRRMVADVVGEDDERMRPCRAQARDRDDTRIAEPRDGLRRVGGGGSDHRGRPRQVGEETSALVERDRMRADLAHLLERNLRRADKRVADREDRLGDDRERAVVEQVVRLVHRPHERALDRQDAVGALLDVTASTTPVKEGCGASRAAGKSRSHAAALCAPSRPG